MKHTPSEEEKRAILDAVFTPLEREPPVAASSPGSENYERALCLAIKTLGLYANPKSYHACAFIPDRPAGWFADDFSYDPDYERKMPGAEARRVIAEIEKLIFPNAEVSGSSPLQ